MRKCAHQDNHQHILPMHGAGSTVDVWSTALALGLQLTNVIKVP